MDEWVSIYEDLPLDAKGYSNISVDVVVKTKKGAIKKAFYGFKQDKWFDFNGNTIRDVTHWKSLEEE